MITKACFTVRYVETDQMGIAHHCNYPIWFEAGRSDYFKKAGIPISKIETLGFFLPLSKMNCEFKNPARFEDEIIIITKIVYMSCVKIKFEYKVLNNINEKVLATGNTVHAWTNKNIEPLNMEKAAPEIYRILKTFVEATDINLSNTMSTLDT